MGWLTKKLKEPQSALIKTVMGWKGLWRLAIVLFTVYQFGNAGIGQAYANLGYVGLTPWFLTGQAVEDTTQNNFRKAVLVDPQNFSSRLGLAISQLQTGESLDASEAVSLLSNDIERDTGFYWLGRAYFEVGKIEDGAVAWRYFAGESPSNRLVMSSWLIKAGFREQAISEIKEVFQIQNLSPDYKSVILVKLARLYQWQNNELAKKYALEATKLSPTNREAYLQLAWAYLALGYYDESIMASQRSLELGQWGNQVYEVLGRAYFAKEDWEPAIEALEQSSGYAPWVLDPHVKLGWAYLHIGQKDEAAKHFRAALEIAPTLQQALNGLSIAEEGSTQ